MTAPFHVPLKGGLVDLCIIIRAHRLWIAEMGEVFKCILNHAGGVVCRQSDGGQGGWDSGLAANSGSTKEPETDSFSRRFCESRSTALRFHPNRCRRR